MRSLLGLSAIALLGASIGACGSTGKGARPASTVASGATVASSVGTTPAGTSTESGLSKEAQRFERTGPPGTAADTRAVGVVVKRFYATVAANDGARACKLLYAPLRNAMAEDYGTYGPSYMHGKSCAEVMTKVFKHRKGTPTTNVTTIEVTGLRMKGKEAAALLHSPAMALGEITIIREGSKWTILTLLGQSFSTQTAKPS
jgi:hypothetical protein